MSIDTRALVECLREALDWCVAEINRGSPASNNARAAISTADQWLRPRADCPECKGSGARDSGGTTPWGEPVYLPCDCSNAPSYERTTLPAEFLPDAGGKK